MARKPSVRQKNGYWWSEARGINRYFGKCSELTHAQATAELWKALAESEGLEQDTGERREEEIGFGSGMDGMERNSKLEPKPEPEELVSIHAIRSKQKARAFNPSLSSPVSNLEPMLTVNALTQRYLDWLLRHRSAASHREAKRHLERWCQAIGEREATAVSGTELEGFQDRLRCQGHALMYVKKHSTTVRACFAKGFKMGWLPPTFKPFAHIESIRLDPKPLLESELPTPEEVAKLLAEAKAKSQLYDIVRLFHATGARTHELLEARAGDFQPQARMIVLGKHKRSRTLREPIPRTITLNALAHEILLRRCEGLEPEALLFPNRNGNPFTSVLFDDMFARLRKRAGVRECITPYSFRHLWISESLMAGIDALLIARMAGTSVKMIESVYGHFKVSSYQEAQAKLDAMRASM